ncbi:MAG TPA: hypothetical protein VGL01_11920, partial [Trinickia sp.]|uniref:hypothetical protein n=1 Tax=Trinickia sp. TaxID=2571163 RepID=UPI002F4300DD
MNDITYDPSRIERCARRPGRKPSAEKYFFGKQRFLRRNLSATGNYREDAQLLHILSGPKMSEKKK